MNYLFDEEDSLNWNEFPDVTVYMENEILAGKLLDHVGGSDGYYLIAKPSIVEDQRQLFVINVSAVQNIVISDLVS